MGAIRNYWVNFLLILDKVVEENGLPTWKKDIFLESWEVFR